MMHIQEKLMVVTNLSTFKPFIYLSKVLTFQTTLHCSYMSLISFLYALLNRIPSTILTIVRKSTSSRVRFSAASKLPGFPFTLFLFFVSNYFLMAGNVYLRTNRFEVKLEGITFKTKDFESLCKLDFLFPDGKTWDSPPVVGLDVMRHPRDPSIILLLLCFGVGCVILRFASGETLPLAIHNFLSDKRIRFVGFGIPEKTDLFPFEEMGLTKEKLDIGYIAARTLKQPKCKRWELAELARKVLGIKRMIGLTEASTFERHEQIKCAVCQLFITSAIAIGLLRGNEKKKKNKEDSPKKSSFLKNLNSLHILAEGWFKLLPKGKRREQHKTAPDEEKADSVCVHIGETHQDILLNDNVYVDGEFFDDGFEDDSSLEKADEKDVKEGRDSDDGAAFIRDTHRFPFEGYGKDVSYTGKMPIKGILKCPSTGLMSSRSSPPEPRSPPSSPNNQTADQRRLKRANSKGCNVSFKFH